MVEIIVNLVLEEVKCLASRTERRLGYLKAEIEKLKDESRSVQRRVSEAERKREKIDEKVKKWQVSTNKNINEAAKFFSDERQQIGAVSRACVLI